VVGSCGLEPTPYEDARAKQEFESCLHNERREPHARFPSLVFNRLA
jgi:hypothetical protein